MGILVPNAMQDLMSQMENVHQLIAALTVNIVLQELSLPPMQMEIVLLAKLTVLFVQMQPHA